jgi:aconitate hydratase
MGVLPLQFLPGESHHTLNLTGEETFTICAEGEVLAARGQVTVIADSPTGKRTEFKVLVRIDTPVELDYYKGGGILPCVLRKLAN